MKQYIIAFLFIVTISVPVVLFGATDSGSLTLQLTVKPVFSISLDESTIDFGIVTPGLGNWGDNPDSDGLGIICQTNKGIDWSLSINTISDLVHTDLVSTIPASAIKWMNVYAETSGIPLSYTFADFAPIDTQPQQLYNSAINSIDNKNGTFLFKNKFMLEAPANSKAGVYETTIIYTMTE